MFAMFFQFFDELRSARIPVTLKEYLALMDALSKDVIDMKVDQFYFLSRTALVKDERNLDKFDRVFGHVFKGLESLEGTDIAQIPEEWLRALTEKFLTEDEKKMIESLGGWEKLMETLKERLEEQKKRHEGGSKMIGSGGTSPFGNSGYNPEGVRIGQDKSRHGKAVKVWDKREYKKSRRFRRTRHAQHQGGAPAPAQMGTAGCGNGTRSPRHDQGHGQQGLSRSQAYP